MIRWVTRASSSFSKEIPNSSRFFRILALPEVLPKAYFRWRPKRSGSKSLKYRFFLLSPSAWIPAVCVNTFSPTTGLFAGICCPENCSTNLETRKIFCSWTLILNLVKSLMTAMTDSKGAFPARSPSPLTVVWIPEAPWSIPSITLATERS